MKYDISKYLISALLLVVGLFSLGLYLNGLRGDGLESQPLAMLFAGLALIIVGVIALPEMLNKLNSRKYTGIVIVGIVASLGLVIGVCYSVFEEMGFQETKLEVQSVTVQSLKDIREIQTAHKSVYGGYAQDFTILEAFAYENVMPVTFNMGSFHDTLNEQRSIEMGYIIKQVDLDSISTDLEIHADDLLSLIEEDNSVYKIRDTIYTSFYAENLTGDIRAEKKLPTFNMKAMQFNPRTGERFRMKTSVVEIGGLWQPTIFVQDPTPFGRDRVKKDTLSFGSLTEAHTDGNWRN
mgnify:CR=1 FL=1|jgi:hypothetical protein|tara:strand:- start:1101 stop:1982 length:882 start_codon:yes stop_codon:yes gene_type:complete